MKHPFSLALAGLLCATGAQAFEVTGGSLSLGYSSFIGSSDATDVSKFAIGGSMEFGLTQQVALQGDLAVTRFDITDLNNTNFGLHGIVHASDLTSVGAYVGQDHIDGADLNYFGFEVAHQLGAIGTEGYVTLARDGGDNGTVIGLKGEYAFAGTALIGAKFDTLNVDGADATRLALTGEVEALPGVSLTGELGQARVEGFGSEPFLGFGVKVNFGEKRGTTFDSRSIINILPGG